MPTYYLEHAAIFLNDLAKKNRQSAGDFSEDTEVKVADCFSFQLAWLVTESV